MPHNLHHLHIVVSANGLAAPPRTAAEIETWLLELVDLVGMKVLFGPHAVRCDTLGNEGVTGLVCIETSHASIHVWDTGCEPFAKMDLYSCMDFDPKAVVEHFRRWQPATVNYLALDRNKEATVLETATITLA